MERRFKPHADLLSEHRKDYPGITEANQAQNKAYREENMASLAKIAPWRRRIGTTTADLVKKDGKWEVEKFIISDSLLENWGKSFLTRKLYLKDISRGFIYSLKPVSNQETRIRRKTPISDKILLSSERDEGLWLFLWRVEIQATISTNTQNCLVKNTRQPPSKKERLEELGDPYFRVD